MLGVMSLLVPYCCELLLSQLVSGLLGHLAPIPEDGKDCMAFVGSKDLLRANLVLNRQLNH